MANARGTRGRGRRGMALLLVMVALCVCLALLAGFMASQGTSIGLVRNTRDFDQARMGARSGIDLCVWMVKNKSDWRRTMKPGVWLDETVSGTRVVVTAEDGDGTGDFADNNTEAVVFASTATTNGRSVTLKARVQPTGGGAVFADGCFSADEVDVGTGDFDKCIVDSYNSDIAPYSSLLPGTSARLVTNSTTDGSLKMDGSSTYRGTMAFGPGANLSAMVKLDSATAIPPLVVSASSEARVAGRAIPPNAAGLPALSQLDSSFSRTIDQAGSYPGITMRTATGVPTLRIDTNELIRVTGRLQIQGGTQLYVPAGRNAVLYVKDLELLGSTRVDAGATLTIYVESSVKVKGQTNSNSGMRSAGFRLIGLESCTTIDLEGGTIFGAIFAPQADVRMFTGTPRIFGGVIAHSLEMTNNAQLHWDEALRSLDLRGITGGSAAPGSPEYLVTWEEPSL